MCVCVCVCVDQERSMNIAALQAGSQAVVFLVVIVHNADDSTPEGAVNECAVRT